MNLNFHIIDIAADFDLPLNLEDAAYDALISGESCESALMAMAELVDWEHATMFSLSGVGKRCERALRQRLLSCQDGRVLDSMAARSACVNALFHELTAIAERIDYAMQYTA